MYETGFRTKLRRIELFVGTYNANDLIGQSTHYKGAIGNVLMLNSKIQSELNKPMPNFKNVQNDVDDANVTLDNIEIYKLLF